MAPQDISGDVSALAAKLQACGARMDGEAVASLIDGIAAAPPSREEAVQALFGVHLDPATRDAVMAAVAARCQGFANALRSFAPERVARLREELRRRQLGGLIVPRSDEHLGEYVPLHAERLAWISGFTGSAGFAIVLADRAAVFVDGRYTLQARHEVDGGLFEIRHLLDEPPAEWIARNLGQGAALGYDPWHLTPAQVERFQAAAAKAGGRLVAAAGNPIDAIWQDQPPPPVAPLVAHDERLAGRSSADKCREVAEKLAEERLDAAVISAPDSLAWLFNVRGADVPFTPVALGFAIVRAHGSAELFIDPRKPLPDARRALGDHVGLRTPDELPRALAELGAARLRTGLDREASAAWFADRLREAGAEVVWSADPCALPKSRKNATELEGMRAAHRRDAAAVCRFLCWLARTGAAVRESEAAARLEAFRGMDPSYRGPSFPTIAGAGPNGAIVHYHLSSETDRPLEPGGLFLVDSGGQYPDGTTDITRTVAVGEPSAEMRTRFTLVLQGHIALATARFPKGTSGSQLDVLARRPLWQAGLDYDHGTGHGVGCYLGVHEGPPRISKLPNRIALEPGMVLSNEPGYYKAGAYGIRTENLLAVRESPAPGGAAPFLEFETITLAPIDRALIDRDLLSADERAWLDDYHRRVRDLVAPTVDEDTREWLVAATRPL